MRYPNWIFLKVASVILVFISVGFYFWQENEKISHPVEIASPAEIENLNNVPEIEDTHNTEIVVTPENSTTSDEPAIDPVIKEVATTEVAAIETKNENSFSKEIPQPADIDSLAEEILLTKE